MTYPRFALYVLGADWYNFVADPDVAHGDADGLIGMTVYLGCIPRAAWPLKKTLALATEEPQRFVATIPILGGVEEHPLPIGGTGSLCYWDLWQLLTTCELSKSK